MQTHVWVIFVKVYDCICVTVVCSTNVQFQLCQLFCQNATGEGFVLNCVSERCGVIHTLTQTMYIVRYFWNSRIWTSISLHMIWWQSQTYHIVDAHFEIVFVIVSFFVFSLWVSLALSCLLWLREPSNLFNIFIDKENELRSTSVLCPNCGYIDIMYIAIVCVHKSLTSFFSTFPLFLFLFFSCLLCLHNMYTETPLWKDKMIQKQRENKRRNITVYIVCTYVCHEVSLWRILGHVQSPHIHSVYDSWVWVVVESQK